MPDSNGKFKGISVPRVPWLERPAKLGTLKSVIKQVVVDSGCGTCPYPDCPARQRGSCASGLYCDDDHCREV